MRRSRRAFALPLVLLLALVAALAATLLVDLQGNTTRSVNRQVKVYEDHHLAAGIRELLDQWLLTGGGDVASRIEADGLAFELLLPQGRAIRVYLEDAQGTVLKELSAVTAEQARVLRRIVEHLELTTPGRAADWMADDGPPIFRVHGPAAVSVGAASEQVLEAIAAASGNPDAARALMRRIRARAGQGTPITREDLSSMTATLDMSADQARELTSFLTAEPTLWRMVVETRHGTLSTSPTDRAAALIQLGTPGQNLAGTGVVVLSWEDAEPPGAP